MNSSRKPTRKPDDATGPVLVADGGAPYHVAPAGDPILAWMDLMEVVEALCPAWPTRQQRIEPTLLRL